VNQVAPAGGIRKTGTVRFYSRAEAAAVGRDWTDDDADLVAEILLIGIENAFDGDALDRILFDNNRVIHALKTHNAAYERVRTAARRRRYFLTGKYDRAQG